MSNFGIKFDIPLLGFRSVIIRGATYTSFGVAPMSFLGGACKK